MSTFAFWSTKTTHVPDSPLHRLPMLLLYASCTAFATALGVVPLVCLTRLAKASQHTLVGACDALAAGMMGGASYILFVEAQHAVSADAPYAVVGGLVAGLLFMALSKTLLLERDASLLINKKDGQTALLVLWSMTVHSCAEGVSIGVSFASKDEEVRLAVLLSLAIHNIPEGLAIAAVLVPQGMPLYQAALWAIFSSLPQPIMAVPSFLCVHAMEHLLPVGLAFAASAMAWVALLELAPQGVTRAGLVPASALSVVGAMTLIAIS